MEARRYREWRKAVNHERLGQAVYNNAVWCDAVCRAHGSPGELVDGMWINRRKTPRFYPNAVTLSEDPGPAVQLKRIHDLGQAGIPGAWSVKDSFRALDLTPLGFQILFDAEWICRAPSRRGLGRFSGTRWGRVASASELADWELAWERERIDQKDADEPRIFLPSLLADRDIAVIAAYDGQRIVAGAIANRTADVVGMSNVFVPASEAGRFRAGCVAGIIEAFPGLPIVGYEEGRGLPAVRSLGFDALGPLRVWVKR